MPDSSPSSSFGNFAAFPGLDLAKRLAPFQYGVIFSWALLGVLIHQVYIYNTRFARTDATIFKVLVHLVLVVEIVSVGVATDLAHYLLVANWGDLVALIRMPWSTQAIALSTSITALIVQLFFLWRIWKVNIEAKVLRYSVLFVIPAAFMHFGCAIALACTPTDGFAVRAGNNTQGIIVEVALAAAFTCDIAITGLMVISLLLLRKEAEDVRSTTSTINVLIVRAIETGAVTTVVAFIELMLFENKRVNENNYFLAAHMPLGRLYSTMLLANLNGRGHFSGASNTSALRSVRGAYDVELNNRSMSFGPAQGTIPTATSNDGPRAVAEIKESRFGSSL